MRVSPFIHTIKKGNRILIYNSLTMERQVFYGKSLREVLKNYKPELIRLGALIPEDASPIDILQKYYVERLKRDKYNNTQVLYFILGTRCNFKCKYCYIEHSNLSLSWNTIKNALNLIKDIKGPKHIRFYGGEPLLYFDTIKRIVATSKEEGLNISYALPTNGSLLSSEICEFLRENNISVMISLDGPQKINDMMRIGPNNNGTYNKISNGIHLLEEYEIPYHIACTIHNHNIDRLSDVLYFLYTNFNPISVNLNYPCDTPYLKFEHSPSYLAEKILKSVKEISKYGYLPGNVYEDIIEPYLNRSPPEIGCGGCNHHIVVAPPNRIGPCVVASSDDPLWIRLKDASLSEIFKTQLFREWNSRHVLKIPKCYACPALSLCNGGCPYVPFTRYGSIWEHDEISCEVTRRILMFLMDLELDESTRGNTQ